jgi:hypothetical protein
MFEKHHYLNDYELQDFKNNIKEITIRVCPI